MQWRALSADTSSAIPGVSLGGLEERNSASFSLVGLMSARRWSRATSKGTDPPIACRQEWTEILKGRGGGSWGWAFVEALALAVRAATASPAPMNAASSSIPSSTHTVLSTSKHTAWRRAASESGDKK